MLNLLRTTVYSSKFGRNATRRGSLTSKHAPPGFYKGKGVPNVGHWNKNGTYKIDKEKLPVYHIPDLANCEFKPYVDWNVPKIKVPALEVPSLQKLDEEYRWVHNINKRERLAFIEKLKAQGKWLTHKAYVRKGGRKWLESLKGGAGEKSTSDTSTVGLETLVASLSATDVDTSAAPRQ